MNVKIKVSLTLSLRQDNEDLHILHKMARLHFIPHSNRLKRAFLTSHLNMMMIIIIITHVIIIIITVADEKQTLAPIKPLNCPI